MDYQIPSVAIAILQDGSINELAVGVKSVSTQAPVTPDTIYQCGSMSKTWTALAFMQMVDEGKIRLDEPVRSYIPTFRVADPDVSASVTPRRLLNHTSGIEEDYGDPGENADVYEQIVSNIANAPQVHPLGYTHGYSAALGYAILARIMEVVDGLPWDEVMKRRLFDPLQLSGTSSWREQVKRDRAATGHLILSPDQGPVASPLEYLPRAFGPGGNINSTAREVVSMAHLFLHQGRAQNGMQIVAPASIREMTGSRVPIPDPHTFGPEWALGLTVCDWDGQTVYGHDGSTVGQSARLRILPDANLAIAMLANGGPRDSFYRAAFNEILCGLGAPSIPNLPKPDLTLRLDFPKYAGTYERTGWRYEVAAKRGKLFLTTVDPLTAEILGRPERVTYELLPINTTQFLMPAYDLLEDTRTVAMYDFDANGSPRYLHMNGRVSPRIDR